jgi:hypothetical protein
MLAARQQELLKRSALLRFELVEQGKRVRESLHMIDQTYTVWQWIKAHPQLPLGALMVLWADRPKRLLRWLPRLLWGWGFLKKVKGWLAL